MEGGYELMAAPGAGSAIIEAALALAGMPCRITPAAPWETGPGAGDVERLAALNPLRQVPVLILPDGTVLTESAAIILHLADRRPEAGLVPGAEDPERPAFLRWLVFLVASVYPTFTFGDDPSRWVPGEEARNDLRASTDAWRQELWTVMEAACGTPWFLGTRFSAIDLYVCVMTRWRPREAWFSRYCPRLHAVAAALRADPRLAAVWERNP